jgi:hypothetical protein
MPQREKNDLKTSASVEAVKETIKAGAPVVYKVLNGAGNMAATALLTVVGYTYNAVHEEWAELKSQVVEIRKDLNKLPTPEEIESLRRQIDSTENKTVLLDPAIRDKIENLNERIIVIESVCCDIYESPARSTQRRPRARTEP